MAQQMLVIWSFEITLINAWCMSLLNHTCNWKCSHVKPKRIENKVLCPTFSKDYIYQTFAFRIKTNQEQKTLHLTSLPPSFMFYFIDYSKKCRPTAVVYIFNKFSVAKATLESQMSVRLSVTKTPQPLRIASIDYWAYRPSSLSTI